MKHFLAAVIFALALIGCDKSSPVESTSSAISTEQNDAMFGEQSMLNSALSKNTSITVAETSDGGVCMHDSLRNQHMLDSLAARLALTDAQKESVQVYGKTLFETLKAIHDQALAESLPRDSVRVLVDAVRDQFVASVKSILTADQLALFEAWLEHFWNPPMHGPGPRHGGPGGRPEPPHGNGGPGGHRP